MIADGETGSCLTEDWRQSLRIRKKDMGTED